MTDASLMDADCIHGVTWYECKTCEEELNHEIWLWQQEEQK